MLALHETRELEQEVCAGQPDVTAIFKDHHRFVWRVLSHLGVAAADLEDALQEVFVVVHRRLPEYREQDKIKAWLYAICVRVARGFKRSLLRRRVQLTGTPPEEAREPRQPEDIANQEALQLAQRMLEALPDKQRAVFLLYEVEQMPMSEVALAVDCPLPTAYARLRKARERVLALVARAKLRGDAP
jgi:RNA polymerase sigma-70 factor (ECF subfamily)